MVVWRVVRHVTKGGVPVLHQLPGLMVGNVLVMYSW